MRFIIFFPDGVMVLIPSKYETYDNYSCLCYYIDGFLILSFILSCPVVLPDVPFLAVVLAAITFRSWLASYLGLGFFMTFVALCSSSFTFLSNQGRARALFGFFSLDIFTQNQISNLFKFQLTLAARTTHRCHDSTPTLEQRRQ